MFRALILLPLLFPLACGGDDDEEPGSPPSIGPERTCDVTLVHEAPAHVEQVQVAGRFNGWSPQDMSSTDEGWVAELGPLTPDVYGYRVLYDGQWQEPPPDVYTTWEGDAENRALYVGDCSLPSLEPRSAEASADGEITVTLQFLRAEGGPNLDTVNATIGEQAVDAEVDEEDGLLTVSASGLPPGKHAVRVSVTDASGQEAEGGQVFVPLWVEDELFRWQSGVLYYLFLDRFADGGDAGFGDTPGAEWGTDFKGGDLVGALERLEDGYFDDLGVTSIWLSPLNQNPEGAYLGVDGQHHYTGYHGYWPIHPREVQDRLGTQEVAAEQALRDFVDAAHDRGIRVVMDVVLNHVHEDHVYVDAHPDWFQAEPCVCTTEPGDCNWTTATKACWFTDYLPNLDYRNHAIVEQMVADTLWWIETFDIDGLRIDAAKHMYPVILRTLSMRIRDRYEAPGGAPFYLVGETFVGQGAQDQIMDHVAPYELDGQFDFPLYYALRAGMAQDGGWEVVADEVARSDAAYGEQVHWMSPFLGNHDVSRFSTDVVGCPDWQLFGGCSDRLAEGSDTEVSAEAWEVVNRLAMTYAFVATQPGVPLLYYGDEIGLAGGGDPDNRRMMMFEEDWSLGQSTLFERFAELGTLRRELPVLQHGERRELWVDGNLYVYARDAGDGDVAIVALHRGPTTRTQSIPLPAGLGVQDGNLVDALPSERSYPVDEGVLELTLDPWEYVVAVPN